MKTKSHSENKAKLSVAFVLFPEFTLSALAGFIDTLRLSADDNFENTQKYCTWTILNVDMKSIKSSCGAAITPWERLRHPIDFDCLVVIGGLVKGHEKPDSRITNYIKEAYDSGKQIVGLCTGSFALAYAGLMKDKTTCVHWFHKPDFQMAFPDQNCITDVLYYEDGRCITCAGGGVAGDVAAHIIESYCGKAIARVGVSGMLMEAPKGLLSPQPHIEAEWFNNIKNPELRRSILVMDRNIRNVYLTETLAKKAGLHKSKFDRLFRKEFGISSTVFFRALRLAHGHRDILYSERTITDIAIEYGFSDASHFTKLYRGMFSVTPSYARNVKPEDTFNLVETSLKNEPEIIKKMLLGQLFFSSSLTKNGAFEKFNLDPEVPHKA